MTQGVSRRTLMRGAGGTAFLGLSALALTRFGTDSVTQSPRSCPSTDLSESERELIVSNWPLYIDEAARRNPQPTTLDDFEAATGITVDYSDDVNDNSEFFARVVNQLGSCETVERDMFMLTDWMAARMISVGWIQELDHANLPNVDANLLENLREPAWDPGRRFSVPWQSGLTGIAYNSDLVDEVGSFTDLLTRSDLAGRVTLLSEMRDTMAFLVAVTGADPEDFDDSDWGNAIDKLTEVVQNGHIRQFTGNNYTNLLTRGDIVACEAWSGDVIALSAEQPNIKFVQPEEGLSLWSDNMMVPNLARHKTNAEAWINFYYEPEVAAKLASWVNYICPVQGAQQAMERIAPDLVENPLIFPTDDFLANTFSLRPLNEAESGRYEIDFSNATGG